VGSRLRFEMASLSIGSTSSKLKVSQARSTALAVAVYGALAECHFPPERAVRPSVYLTHLVRPAF